MEYRNVLKYPGSKWRIADQIVSLMPPHHSYIEPFFGSGAVFFRKEKSNIETINDMDNDVVNLFECIREDPERLATLIELTPFAREEYERRYADTKETDKFKRSLNLLVKCWQGHGFRTNGCKNGWKNDVIGRERAYSLHNWNRLPGWVMDIANRLKDAQIDNKPALEIIQKYNYTNALTYLDPPYLLGSRTGKQYKHEMYDQDHETMLKEIKKSKAMIMISGYDSEMYCDYLQEWSRYEFDTLTENSRKRKEVLWVNFKDTQMSVFDFIK